ncbi:unnamed protein product [Caenorhabditis angaria]|uniref:Ribonuclease H1 N-terminal domain-containing protein n=1 Tax=Caenorhabditis angaria TaxID=860376 RepID=A0A9P1IFG0_9PELO|nr:unnamed protein product [Caenorhabditis angaria]
MKQFHAVWNGRENGIFDWPTADEKTSHFPHKGHAGYNTAEKALNAIKNFEAELAKKEIHEYFLISEDSKENAKKKYASFDEMIRNLEEELFDFSKLRYVRVERRVKKDEDFEHC